jgi:hypothetical protein
MTGSVSAVRIPLAFSSNRVFLPLYRSQYVIAGYVIVAPVEVLITDLLRQDSSPALPTIHLSAIRPLLLQFSHETEPEGFLDGPFKAKQRDFAGPRFCFFLKCCGSQFSSENASDVIIFILSSGVALPALLSGLSLACLRIQQC